MSWPNAIWHTSFKQRQRALIAPEQGKILDKSSKGCLSSPTLGKEVFQTQGHPYTAKWKLKNHMHERASPKVSPKGVERPLTPYSALKQQMMHIKSRTIAFLKLRYGVKSRVATEQPACRWLLTCLSFTHSTLPGSLGKSDPEWLILPGG